MREQEVIQELKRIAADNGGILTAENVVLAASDPQSPLHPKFTWDDTKAAHAYRLWQARQLISVTVEYIGRDDEQAEPTRVFVSLTTDRKSEGGRYRQTAAVMRQKSLRAQLLADAMQEMERFQVKYARLKELAEVFEAMRRVRKAEAA